MTKRKENIIKTLNLKPHPEGGYFKEVYRCNDTIRTVNKEFPHGRNISTSIYYLLGGNDISRFHRIKSDEIWHHYEGSSITIHTIHENGEYNALHLGKNLDKNQSPQQIVPANTWFGVTVDEPDSFTLCGCTVAPGFDFSDFQMAERDMMLKAYPEHEKIIKRLIP